MIVCAVFAGLGLVAGGAILFSFVHAPSIALFPRFLFGGMIFYGGLAGALIGLRLFSIVRKQDFGNTIRVAIPVFPLVHGMMRLACFAAGCCHGIVHETLGIAFTRSPVAPNGVPFLPVQLYEAALNLIIFAVIWLYSRKPRNPIHLVCLYAIPYAIGRFALEFLRGDQARGTILALSTSQFISIMVVLACIAVLIFNHVKHKRDLSSL
jgi:phosphatidylglycerol:prolipoprotein diacylglycerol transferase